jgi:hypothetical protein
MNRENNHVLPTTNTKVGEKLLERWQKMFVSLDLPSRGKECGHVGNFCATSKGSHFHQGTIGVEEGAQFWRGFHHNKRNERAKRLLIVVQKKWLWLRIYPKI